MAALPEILSFIVIIEPWISFVTPLQVKVKKNKNIAEIPILLPEQSKSMPAFSWQRAYLECPIAMCTLGMPVLSLSFCTG